VVVSTFEVTTTKHYVWLRKKTQFIFSGAHDNSHLQHDFCEAAPSRFSSISVSVNSAIRLHCSLKTMNNAIH
jgi:hypothetical protein